MDTNPVLRGRRPAALLAGWVVASAFAAPTAFAAAPVIDETIAPAQISIGESAELRIKSSGSDLQSPRLPVVPGLEFHVVQQLQGVEFIRGVTLATTTLVVRVTPEIAGTFLIPGIAPKSPPLMLRVTPQNVGGSSMTRSGSVGETAADGIRMTEDGSAFIRLSTDRREVYVGESVPIAIELGMRAGAVTSLNGLPTLTGSDFTLNDLSRQPDRKETVIGGQPFLLLTWHSVLAPVKPGDFPLAVELPMTVRVSSRPKREALLEDQLGDPFMQNVFGPSVRKDIKAASPPLDLTVDALPAEGRPREFSGAVGTFKMSSDISSATAAAGDPLTLKMHVTGTGNFDRVDSAMLEHVEHWKTYPPTSSFKASDLLGFKGEKTFEQPVIASAPGAQVLPGLTFAYFDPVARRYETLRTSPLNVAISPSAADSTLNPPQGPSATGPKSLTFDGTAAGPQHARARIAHELPDTALPASVVSGDAVAPDGASRRSVVQASRPREFELRRLAAQPRSIEGGPASARSDGGGGACRRQRAFFHLGAACRWRDAGRALGDGSGPDHRSRVGSEAWPGSRRRRHTAAVRAGG